MKVKLSWDRLAFACVLLSLILITATIVIYALNRNECNTMIVPTYSGMLASMKDFKYKTKASRFTAQSVILYKLEALNKPDHAAHKWKLDKFTDYALHRIVVSDVIDNPRKLEIFNDKNFGEVMADFDISGNSFYNPASREKAIDLLLKYPDISDEKNKTKEYLKDLSNEQIYMMLVHGVVTTSSTS